MRLEPSLMVGGAPKWVYYNCQEPISFRGLFVLKECRKGCCKKNTKKQLPSQCNPRKEFNAHECMPSLQARGLPRGSLHYSSSIAFK
jgi:hypothetical protein